MDKDVEEWLTDAQMMAIWHDRDVANGMMDWARAQTDEIRARAHPKIPHVEKARQYKVQVEDKFIKTMEDVVQQGMKMGFNAEGSAGEDIVRSKLARSASIFGGNGPTAGAKSAVPTEKRALSPGEEDDESGDDLPAEKKRRDRLKDFKEQEAERAKKAEDRERQKDEKSAARKLEAQQAKEDRQAQAKTPAGRAKVWLSGLQEHILTCETEMQRCKATDSPLPGALSEEYAGMWQGKITAFKRARGTIEQALNGNKQVKDFEGSISKAEGAVKSFKSDIQRYRMLYKSYAKSKNKNSATAGDDDDE